jgi:signal transduction histidine kinase
MRNGEKLFGIYATFHRNPEARGLGLFITHNQIDSVGGKILVESKVDEGSKFTIIW